MADAMVTARMSPEKKEAGNRVLEQLGTNASQAVNRLYDYVIEKKELPFPEEGRPAYTREDIERAIEWADGVPGRRASGTRETRIFRQAAKGHIGPGDGR